MDLSEGAHNNILMLSEFFETERQDGSLDAITKRASSCVFTFTCIYQQRYPKRLSLVETARSVPKLYHCAFVVLFFQRTKPPSSSVEEETLEKVIIWHAIRKKIPNFEMLPK